MFRLLHWDDGLRQQCQQQVEAGEGVNYDQARAAYGEAYAGAIFQELNRRGETLAFVSEREHQRLVEWRGTGDGRANGIIKNIIAYTCGDVAAEQSRDEQLRQQCQQQVEAGEGVNYAQARATYGPAFADAIFQPLHRHNVNFAYLTQREHERLTEWRNTGDGRSNGIIKNVVEFSLSDD